MLDHTHEPDYAPSLTGLVNHVIAAHPEIRLIRTRADQPRDRRPTAAKHQAAHPDIWGAEVTRERDANKAAQFHAISSPDGLPAIEVAGVLVFAYIKDGYLRVSVDLDTVESWLLTDESGELLVPIRIAVGDEDVWCTSPNGTTVQQARLIPPGRAPEWPDFGGLPE